MKNIFRTKTPNENKKIEEKGREQDILDKNRKIEEIERKHAEELALEKKKREEQQVVIILSFLSTLFRFVHKFLICLFCCIVQHRVSYNESLILDN